MKGVLILLLFFSALSAQANDTLTRARVYNFNVGDTFDYRNHTQIYWRNTTYSSDTTTYTRYLVTNISYSPDSTTKYIQQERLFPLPDTTTTLTLSNLLGYEVLLDTTGSNFCHPTTISVAPTSQFHGRSIDTLTQGYCPLVGEEFVFADGLGPVLSIFYDLGCGMCSTSSFDTTALIYYTKGTEIWGVPYYDFPIAVHVQELNATNDQISLFPTVNDGTFNLQIADVNLLPVYLMVYDVTGREVKQLNLNKLNNNVSVESCSAGVYIWKAISKAKFIQTGKMVVK